MGKLVSAPKSLPIVQGWAESESCHGYCDCCIHIHIHVHIHVHIQILIEE